MNFARGTEARIHHLAFELRDVWGVGPAKEASEFSPAMRGVK
jgi:hypothetical protein